MGRPMNHPRINIGDQVLVAYPIGEWGHNPARELDGQTFTVKSVHIVKGNKNKVIKSTYYELYGAKSRMGVHYAFLEDELIKL